MDNIHRPKVLPTARPTRRISVSLKQRTLITTSAYGKHHGEAKLAAAQIQTKQEEVLSPRYRRPDWPRNWRLDLNSSIALISESCEYAAPRSGSFDWVLGPDRRNRDSDAKHWHKKRKSRPPKGAIDSLSHQDEMAGFELAILKQRRLYGKHSQRTPFTKRLIPPVVKQRTVTPRFELQKYRVFNFCPGNILGNIRHFQQKRTYAQST